MKPKFPSLIFVLPAILFISSTAAGQKPPEYIIKNQGSVERPHQIGIIALVNRNSIGGALWYSLPIRHDGILPRLNDSLHAEAGLVTHYGSPSSTSGHSIALAPAGGVRWDFHFTKDWTLFTAAKFGWVIDSEGSNDGLTLNGTVGAIWHFDSDVSMRIESGYDGLAQVGVSFPL
jgi:hypothetical protein